jgi:hypothetical protein
MRKNAPRLIGTRAFTMALFWISTGLLLSASSCMMPGLEPSGQERRFDAKAYQKLGEDRRNNDGCRVKACM